MSPPTDPQSTQLLLYLALGALAVTFAALTWLTLDKVKRIEGNAYRALTKASATELAWRQAVVEAKDDLRAEIGAVTGALDARLREAERATSDLRVYVDAAGLAAGRDS